MVVVGGVEGGCCGWRGCERWEEGVGKICLGCCLCLLGLG